MSQTLLRSFKLLVLVAFPALAFVYAYQFTNQNRELVIPFKPFQKPANVLLHPAGDSSREVPLTFRAPITLLNFWASNCAPCVEEFPALLELQRQLEAKGVEIVFVSVDEDWKDVLNFQKQNNISLSSQRLFWDPSKDVAKAWGSLKFPESYVMRRDGWVVEKIIGAQQWTRPPVLAYFQGLAEKFRSIQAWMKIPQSLFLGLEAELYAAPASTQAPDLIHEEDKKSLDKLRNNIDVASKNLRSVEALLREEKRNLEEQSVLKERRTQEEMEATREVEKMKSKRNDVKVILDKNTDSQSAEKRERKNAEERVRKVQNRIKDLQKELEDEKSRLQESNKDLNTRIQQIETFEEARKSSQEELGTLEKRVSFAQEALKAKHSSTQEAESALKERGRKVREAESQVEKAKKVLEDQKSKLSEFEKVLQK